MVEESENNDLLNTPFKPPIFLKVLAILSLVAITFGLLGAIGGLFSGPLSAEEIEQLIQANLTGVERLENMGETYWAETTTKIMNLINYTNANFYMDRLINIGAYSIGLIGVISMLRGKKIGFHHYIIYNLVALTSIYASAPVSAIPPFYFMLFGFISLLLIFMYSRNLKFLK